MRIKGKRKFIFSALFFSFILHILVISACSLRIRAKKDPLIYSWSNVIEKKDLFLKKKNVVFPAQVDFSSDSLRRKYFFSPSSPQPHFLEDKKAVSLPKGAIPSFKERSGYFYLWEKISIFSSWEQELVSYQAYVSPYGKVLFLYPEKLAFNSYGNLHLQEHIREAALFLNDRFFWTRLEGVVK